MTQSRLTLGALAAGELHADDLRVTPEALHAQADQAIRDRRAPLAANLRRAAELVDLPDAELLSIYELLRPRRATAAELEALAGRLEGVGARETAALVRSAAVAYNRRGLVKDSTSRAG